MNFDELLTNYLGWLQIRNYSPRTVSDYGHNLGPRSSGSCEQTADHRRAGHHHGHADRLPTLVLLPADQTRPGPRRRRIKTCVLATVKSFFRFLKNEGYHPRQSRRGGRVCPRAAQPAPERFNAQGSQSHH